MRSSQTPAMPELTISLNQVCFVIVKLRQFEVKDVATVADPGSNASDDGMADVLEDRPGDATQQELRRFISALDIDRQADLVALAWLGRGDYDLKGWEEARRQAAERHTENTAGYLIGMPLASEFLDDALSQMGLSCEAVEEERL